MLVFVRSVDGSREVAALGHADVEWSYIATAFPAGSAGRQQVLLAINAWNTTSIVKLRHALGLIHEHKRPDRNNFVTITPSGP